MPVPLRRGKLCETLKRSEPTRYVPIIALTAYADADTSKAARAAGCAAVAVKPCVSADLRGEIAKVLDACSKTPQEPRAVQDDAHSVTRQSKVLTIGPEGIRERMRPSVADSTDDDASVVNARARVRAEFVEMRGLRLSVEQAARFLGLDRSTAARILEGLVQEGFLQRTASGLYGVAA